MSNADLSADEITLPVKRTDGETLRERLTGNAYDNILPARYLRKNADGDLIEEQEDLFARVAKNIALAEVVFEAEKRDVDVTVTPSQLKPDHPRRDELAAEAFGAGTTAAADAKTALSVHNVNKFAYDTVVPELPAELREHVEDVQSEFQELMEQLSFVPNSPTLMNAGDELQQLSACFVDSPEDDLTDIHQTAKEAAEVFQCLTGSSTVTTEDDGIVSVSEVEAGDHILQKTDSGFQYRQVEKTHEYEDASTLTVSLSNGRSIHGTPNHRIKVDDEWTRLDEIQPGQEVYYALGWLRDAEWEPPELASVAAGAQWSDNRGVDNDAIVELYQRGLSDYEIADRLDCGKSTVQRRRNEELQLPPNGSGGRKPGATSFDEDEALSLYREGHSDSEVARSLDTGPASVQRFRIREGLSPNGQPVKAVRQPDQLTEELAELLGLWLGDGSWHEDGIRFHVSRESVAEYIDQLSKKLFDTGTSTTFADGCFEVTVNSHEIRRWWEANFDCKDDAKSARVPAVIQRSPAGMIESFLRGYFTADGTLLNDAYPKLYSASEEAIDGVATLMMGLGYPIKKSVIRDEDAHPYYGLIPTTGQGREAFLQEVGFIDGRRETALANIESVTTRDSFSGEEEYTVEVESVTESPDATVYDITVADNHEYITDGIISHNSGGGMGYAFWQLRPYGDAVGSTGGIASGPMTFMETFDQMCETIAQGGTRRGAQMGVMRVSHPDVIEFIHAKNKDVSLAHSLRLNDPDDYTYTSFSEALEEARGLIDDEGKVPKHLRNAVEGHLSNFNISVGVTDGFMEALNDGEEFTFTNPRTGEAHVATEETKEMYSRYGLGEHVDVGEEFSIDPRLIWDRIVSGAHENGEPGVIYLERVNKEHSFDVEEHPDHRILATNPCGEQPLEEYEACNLGHINLSTLAAEDAPDWRVWADEHGDAYDSREAAVDAFLENAIDFEEFDYRIETGSRFLENVVTMSDFPVPEIDQKVREMRKIGLGIMGLAQLYIQLGIPYGSDEGNEVARQLMRHINHESKWTAHELAEERGSFEEWDNSKYADPTRYREWFEHQTGLDADDWEDGFAIRNHNTTTIAPTGTTSMVGNTTGGCEPIYNVAYYKNVSDDVQGDEMLVEFDDYFLRTLEANDIDVGAVKREAQEQMATNEFDGVEGLETVPDAIGELFVVTGDLSGKDHAAVQCACQEGVDSAISKTCNFPSAATKEDMDEVYRYIYDHGGKGVTVYRDGTRSKQVLTTRADNAEFSGMDEEEAAAVIAEQIEEVFGGFDAFLESEAVRAALDPRVDDLLDDDEPADYAEKQPRPDALRGVTQRIDTGYGKVYVNINEDENGRPFELFANIGHSGGFTNSFTEALAKVISTALRSGVDPEEIVDELKGTRSPKVAWDKGEQIQSIPDAIGTAMRRYLDDEIDKPYPKQQNLTELAEEGTDATGDESSLSEPASTPETDGGAAARDATDATDDLIAAGESPECPDCGAMTLYFSEGCKTCESCGWSEC
jgi:ribonucleoside-diphosphate reductase alpha chain